VNVRSEPVVLWSDHRIAMRLSPIHGIGTFATEPLPAGTVLTRREGGIVYSTADWAAGRVRLAGEMYNEERIGPDLLAATPKANHYYFNHSCDPNVVEEPGSRTQRTARDVAIDEELTVDYLYVEGRWPDEPCMCGSANCRNPAR
jgi:SET domain-containing protein